VRCNGTRVRTLLAWLIAALVAITSGVGCAGWKWKSSADSFPALVDCGDPKLQAALEAALEEEGYMPAVREKKLALVLVDVTDFRRPRLAELNSREMMYAASVSKLGILFAAFVLIERGELELDEATRESMERIVRKSSNLETARLFDRIGGPRIAEILQSEPYRLYDPELGGGIWVGKSYDKSPPWRRDPIAGLSHGANAIQVARFYYLIGSGQAFSPELNGEIAAIFSKPGIQHKFVKGLEGRENRTIYRKSGTWRNFHADAGVVERTDDLYIIVALAEHPRGEEKLQRIIQLVDDVMDAEGISRSGPPGRTAR
jgi:beta-lactamase class A